MVAGLKTLPAETFPILSRATLADLARIESILRKTFNPSVFVLSSELERGVTARGERIIHESFFQSGTVIAEFVTDPLELDHALAFELPAYLLQRYREAEVLLDSEQSALEQAFVSISGPSLPAWTTIPGQALLATKCNFKEPDRRLAFDLWRARQVVLAMAKQRTPDEHKTAQGRHSERSGPAAVERRQTLDSTIPVAVDGQDRRATVDAFILKCKERLSLKITRTHIWRAVGHEAARQFQYWQSSNPKVTAEDKKNFRRILEMNPIEFEALLRKKRII